MSTENAEAFSTREIAPSPPEAAAENLHVVGVGASAGGLEALERFFKAVPADSGMAFVVIQHLSPDFKSLMDELLARHTRMAIHRVEDGMAVEANCVYLIPPKKEMIISGGRLLLTDKDPQEDLSLPIDRFFRSLAQDAGRRATAIVLSGTGSDGSRGIRDINEAGGLVIAQSEETAKFDGMPKSARDTGVVDLVLSPEEMPKALLDHAAGCRAVPDVTGVDLDGLDAIFKLLRDEYGIDFSYYKPNTVGRRIERRLTLSHSVDLDGYVERLRSDADELNALYRDLLIGVTRFFRDREAFERLERDVIPELLTRKKSDSDLRVWVAGCATGEEAYSLAILLDERLKLLGRPMNVKIFASDVHRASLEVASAGVYDGEKLAEVTPARLDRYFVRKPDGYHVAADLRQMLVFAVHNIIKDAPFTKLDLISCRNMLIYLQPAVQKKAISLFHFGLRTGGVLFLGPSESPGELSAEFEDLDQHWKIYRKRRDIRLPADMRLPLSAAHFPSRGTAPAAMPSGGFDSTLAAAYDRLLDRYMPAGLLVTDRRQLVHSFGEASRYLAMRTGRVTTDLLELVSEDLKLPLAGALQRAAKDQKAVVYSGVRVTTDAGEERLKLAVEPILNRHSNLTHLFVSFECLGAPRPPAAAPAELAADQVSRELVTSLESELHYTRENLQATVEELETGNEEMQATNEELVASNEELQSTNEELHSVNEELYTVNAEYQKKIAELTELTEDMDNLLRSTDIGTIFLDKNLCIRKFTPQIARAFDLLPHDVGRRIDSFSHNIRYADLLSDLTAVLKGAPPVEKEVQDRHGQWFFLRILPYRSHSALAGVVLSLIDISLLKRAEARLGQMSAIVESSNDAIVGMGVDGRVTTWNRGAQKLFGYAAEEIIGQPVSLLEPEGTNDGAQHAWVAEALEKVRAGRSADCHWEVARRRKDGTSIDVLLSVSPIFDLGGTLGGASLIARDITERKRAERALAERARLAALRADIGVALAQSEELRAILQHCTEIVVEHLHVAIARVWTLSPPDQTLELQASAGLYTHLDGPDGRVPLGELTLGRIAQTRRSLFTNDVTHDPHIGDYEWAKREGVVAFAGYPLVVSERVVGVLAVFAREELPQSVVDDLGSLTYEIAQCVERKRAEEASQHYARELESANEELRELVAYRQRAEEQARDGVERRDRFLAILSHELRNPLAAVLNAANLLESASENPDVLCHAQGAIRRQSQQMARLLDDLLDVSRITRNRIDIRRQIIDVCGSSRDAIDAVRPMCDGRGHELHTDLPGEPLWIDGDPTRLQQIQVNLLANAIKYTPPRGQVRLSVRREGEEVVLRVRDSGVGIPPSMHEKVFELFVQLDGAVGNSDGGMGVGLTLVRALVGLHGGTVTVNSDGDGSGSEFVVRLPAAKGPHRTDLPQAPTSDLAGMRVLVVDDNEDIRTTTLELLKLVGCDATGAEDGPRGIEAIGRDAPEVAIIDIGMPGMNGYEVARRVRELPDSESILLIAVTGFGQEDDRTRALGAGFNAHLVKPIDLSQLSAVVTRLRNEPRSHQPGNTKSD